MEKQLNDASLQHLQQIALRKVAVMLWKQNDILALFEDNSKRTVVFTSTRPFNRNQRLRDQHGRAENMIKSRLSKLKLPELLLKKVICLLTQVGLEIIKWIVVHSDLLVDPAERNTRFGMPCSIYRSNLDRRALAKICFTSLATVDYKKTAEELICHNMLDNVQRYKLACFYCLDSHIPRLWENLSEGNKKRFYDAANTHLRYWSFETKSLKLELCWPYILKGQIAKLDSMFWDQMPFYQRAFVSSAEELNEAATQYFYQKLTHEERELLLYQTARGVVCKSTLTQNTFFPLEDRNFPATLRYLFIQMSHEQQMKLLQEFPANSLRCFLQWPWLNYFLDIAELTWDFLPASDFYTLLMYLYEHVITSGCGNFELFYNFFVHSRSIHRRFFVDKECTGGGFFSRIIDAEDTETISLILRSIDAADKARLVSIVGVQNCFFLITHNKWHLLKEFIRVAMLSEEDRGSLREKCRQLLETGYKAQVESKIWKLEKIFKSVYGSHKIVSSESSEDEKAVEVEQFSSEE